MPTALVTGATRGLGRALSFELARRGHTVLGTALNSARLEALARDAGQLPIRPIRADVTSDADNADLAKRVASSGLDVLIHNAGVLGPRVELADYPRADFEEVLRVNTTGPFALTAALSGHLNPGAKVIFVSSGVGNQTRPRWGAYCVSKWGLESVAGIYAHELRERGVQVFVVDPGAMRTEMRAAAYPDEDPMTLVTPEQNLAVFRWLLDEATLEQSGGRYIAKEFR